MSALRRDRNQPRRRGGVRRAVVLMPNGLTLANLLCGIYAIILSIRGELASAPGSERNTRLIDHVLPRSKNGSGVICAGIDCCVPDIGSGDIDEDDAGITLVRERAGCAINEQAARERQ